MPENALIWDSLSGSRLAQGDYLPSCPVPVFASDYGLGNSDYDFGIRRADSIVLTQSCDLENNKVELVALCPILTLPEMAAILGPSANKGYWEQIRLGRQPALHMLASPARPDDNRDVRVVDFREIYSLPVGYLARHAESLGPR